MVTELEQIMARSLAEARAEAYDDGHARGFLDGAEANRRYIMGETIDNPFGDGARERFLERR